MLYLNNCGILLKYNLSANGPIVLHEKRHLILARNYGKAHCELLVALLKYVQCLSKHLDNKKYPLGDCHQITCGF